DPHRSASLRACATAGAHGRGVVQSPRLFTMPIAVRTLRLTCSEFYVDMRLTAVEARWLASADTPDGPSVGTGGTPLDALVEALEPFDGAIHELLACLPPDLAIGGPRGMSVGSLSTAQGHRMARGYRRPAAARNVFRRHHCLDDTDEVASVAWIVEPGLPHG